LLGVLAGQDARDATSSRRAVPDYESLLDGGVRGLKIGVPLNYYFEVVDPGIRELIDAALAALERAGAVRVQVRVPAPQHLTEVGRAIMYSESAALHGEWLRTRAGDYSAQVRARAATGIAIPAATYLEALQLRAPLLRRFVGEVFSACDVLVTPALAVPVPTLASTDVGSSPLMWATIAALGRCFVPFNVLGLPALSVPVGFTAGGLPAGLQLVGRPFAEATLLGVAAAYQAVSDWHERLPPVG
jgi:aspartyl-tRNA(Asn)/glutamyl-tRNA(Gln) amidotransferase subunit A